MKVRPPKSRGGFSFGELVVKVTVLIALVVTVSLRSESARGRSNADKILWLVRTLRSACAEYHTDTGEYAWEYSKKAARNRMLSAIQNLKGWDGPYIDEPFTPGSSNPFGKVHLYDDIAANGWLTGFDTDGNTVIDVYGEGNMLWLEGVGEFAAKRLDDALDAGLPGPWAESGVVRYGASDRDCLILIYH